MMTIGQRIRTLRVLYWMSQEKFAQQVGVSRRQVAYWEHGDDIPSADRVPLISAVLNVTPEWLLSGKKLSDVYDSRIAQRNRAHFQPLRAPLIHQISQLEDFNAANQDGEWIEALAEDQGAVVVQLPDTSLVPYFNAGDQIFFMPVNLDFPAPLIEYAMLNGRHVAASLNGEHDIYGLNVESSSPQSFDVHLTTLRGRKAQRRTVRKTDALKLHAVAYKCVRAL